MMPDSHAFLGPAPDPSNDDERPDPWFPLCPSDAVWAVALAGVLFLFGVKAWLVG